jgi:hypothetical protein
LFHDYCLVHAVPKRASAERNHNPDGGRFRGEPDAGNPPVRFDVAEA